MGRAMIDVEEMARRKRVRPGSIRSAHYRANKTFQETEEWPTGFPRPDRGRPLLGWYEDRPDVIAYLADDAPELHDPAWLAAQVADGLFAQQIADQLGVTKRTVLAALDRASIEPVGGHRKTRLDDVPLAELEDALVHYTHEGVAEMFAVSGDALRSALRRKRAEAGTGAQPPPDLHLADQLGVSRITVVPLVRAGITDVEAIADWTIDDLRRVEGLGRRRRAALAGALDDWRARQAKASESR